MNNFTIDINMYQLISFMEINTCKIAYLYLIICINHQTSKFLSLFYDHLLNEWDKKTENKCMGSFPPLR